MLGTDDTTFACAASAEEYPNHVTLAYHDLVDRFAVTSTVTRERCVCYSAAAQHYIITVTPKAELLTDPPTIASSSRIRRIVHPVPLVNEGPTTDTRSMRERMPHIHYCMGVQRNSSHPLACKTFMAFVDIAGNVAYYEAHDASASTSCCATTS